VKQKGSLTFQYHPICIWVHKSGHNVLLPYLHLQTCKQYFATLTFSRLAAFEDSHAKTTGSHVALRACNLGAESGRELFKGSKDTAQVF